MYKRQEEQSFSTVENLAYSRVMIEKREALLNRKPVPARQPRIGIITSNFHLCRAGMIAKKQNYGTVYGKMCIRDRPGGEGKMSMS